MGNMYNNEAIVILGAAVWKNAQPSPTLLRRTQKGYEIYKKTNCNLICSGGVGVNLPSEAECMRQILTALGVPDEKIFLENESTSTLKNLLLSSDVANLEGLEISAFVSDFYHVPRIKLLWYFLHANSVRVYFSRSGLNQTGGKKLLLSVCREALAIIALLATECIKKLRRIMRNVYIGR